MLSTLQARAVVLSTLGQIYGAGGDGFPKPYKPEMPRYLWTDAHAVMNYCSLFLTSTPPGDVVMLERARGLIENTEKTLGYTRDLKTKLPGLRIGKEDPRDDGQYLHYLTKWCAALNRFALVSNECEYNERAIHLAEDVFPRFIRKKADGSYALVWKMNIWLTHPMVDSEVRTVIYLYVCVCVYVPHTYAYPFLHSLYVGQSRCVRFVCDVSRAAGHTDDIFFECLYVFGESAGRGRLPQLRWRQWSLAVARMHPVAARPGPGAHDRETLPVLSQHRSARSRGT